MFDIGAGELLVIVIVAIVVIGPKDMPMALRAAGRWIAKMRRVSNHFRSGIETMIREAELEEMEREWAERNKRIMATDPATGQPRESGTGVVAPGSASGALAADELADGGGASPALPPHAGDNSAPAPAPHPLEPR